MKPAPLFSAALALALLSGCARHTAPEGGQLPALPAAKVRVVAVHLEDLPSVTEVTGTVRPVQRAQLAAKLMGAIEEMPVALGQRVRRDDLLVKIAAGEINARVTQAQSQLNAARRDLDRERDLLARGASTADLVRGLEDRFTAAQAMVREAEVMLGYATIRAPFDGVIARKLADAGDLASPGMPLLEIEGAAGFEVEAGVPDSLAPTLAVGRAIPVEIPAAGVTVPGRLAEISSAADAGARTVAVKLALPAHEAVRSGQFVRVRIPGAPVRALLVPVSAVARVGQMERVFVAGSGDRAVLRLVKTGARHGERVEILAGLDDGERVVADAPAGLQEGQPLEIQP
jgi:RND family efflux transporter MFP subunit